MGYAETQRQRMRVRVRERERENGFVDREMLRRPRARSGNVAKLD